MLSSSFDTELMNSFLLRSGLPYSLRWGEVGRGSIHHVVGVVRHT